MKLTKKLPINQTLNEETKKKFKFKTCEQDMDSSSLE